jgi:hypothetical protein
LTIGGKTLPTTFFVINGKGAYNLLLGRDWIHVNCCVPSIMHQCLTQWVRDKIEVVPGDSSYIIASAESKIKTFIRRFISNLSDKIKAFSPLLKLKADLEFVWGAE